MRTEVVVNISPFIDKFACVFDRKEDVFVNTEDHVWECEELRNYKQSYKRISKELVEHSEFGKVKSLFEQIENMNAAIEVDCIQSELVDGFQRYGVEVRNSGSPGLSCIAFYWAGGEIAPWVPTTVVADGFSDFQYTQNGDHCEFKPRDRIFHFQSAFELGEVGEILNHVAESEDLKRSALRDLLEKMLILKSLEYASEALVMATRSDSFEKLPKRGEDFCFFATPGHDEPTIQLWPSGDRVHF